MQGLDRLEKLIITPTKRYGTSFEHEDGFAVPFDQVEEYMVTFDKMLVATFWISNHFEDSILMHIPVDIVILNYILGQMKVREFPNKFA